MIVFNLKLCLTIRLWNIYHFAAILLLSIFLYLGFILVYDVFGETIFSDSIFVILESYYFYLCRALIEKESASTNKQCKMT